MKNKVKCTIWDRDFELSVVFQNFPGEEVTASQEKISDSLESFDFDISLSKVKEYIIKWNSEEVGSLEISNIFKYVIPKSVLIPREDEKQIFALMCNYKFDMEHGMAIVFENGKLKEVGPQDIIL